MCVIIDRAPGVVIPGDMIELACDINKHGFGIAFADHGHVEIIKSTKQPNDPSDVMKLLQALKGKRIFLHLRHATVGAVNEANQHPFVSMVGRRDKPLIAMMHNGTMHSYSPPFQDKATSDTFLFNKEFVEPLFARVRKSLGEKKIILDSFVRKLLAKEIGNMSKVVFFDAFGNALFINKELGKQYEGWWASNDYSFDKQHARSSHKTHVPSWVNPHLAGKYDYLDDAADWERGDDLKDLPWMQEPARKTNVIAIASWEKELVKEKGGDLSSSAAAPHQTAFTNSTRQKWETEKLGNLCKAAMSGKMKSSIYIMSNDNKSVITRSERLVRDPFIAQAGLPSLDAVGAFSEDDLMECATNWPQATAHLIIDLLYERLTIKNGLKHFQDKAEGLEAQVKNQKSTIGDQESRLTNQAAYVTRILAAFKAATGKDYPNVG